VANVSTYIVCFHFCSQFEDVGSEVGVQESLVICCLILKLPVHKINLNPWV